MSTLKSYQDHTRLLLSFIDMTLKGGCLCGQVVITIDDAALPLSFAACHCLNCSCTASSPFSLVSLVGNDKIKIDGQPKVYKDKATTSGNEITRHFCPECGTPIMSRSPGKPQSSFVKAGLFSKTLGEVDKPQVEIFTVNRKKRFSWLPSLPGAKQVEVQ